MTGAGPDAHEDSLPQRFRALKNAVAEAARSAGRQPDSVRILVATKTVPPDRIASVLAAGADLIGENRVQEVVDKYDALSSMPHESHFIGHLQRNKVNSLLGRVTCVQTVDSAALAGRLQQRLSVIGSHLDVMIQVNVSGEATKAGVDPAAAADLVTAIAALDRLRLVGYMTVGLNSPDRGAVRSGYALLRRLREDFARQGLPGAATARELSMGMSGDFPDAIAEGATIVRLGSAVFGSRPPVSR